MRRRRRIVTYELQVHIRIRDGSIPNDSNTIADNAR